MRALSVNKVFRTQKSLMCHQHKAEIYAGTQCEQSVQNLYDPDSDIKVVIGTFLVAPPSPPPTPAHHISSSNFISRRIQYDTFHTHNISTIS